MNDLEATTRSAGAALAPAPIPQAAIGTVFVGRERELGEMRAVLDAACAGTGRLVLVVGEAGVGKSRIAAELAQEARVRACRILVGRCHEQRGAPAYWPWIQIIRSLAEERGPSTLLADLGPCATDIAQIVPALRDWLGDLPAAALLQPEQARFRAFDSIAVFFRRLALEQPLVIFIEDLHWADPASLMLLVFLVRELAESRALIVTTHREEEVGRTHPLAATLAELARHAGSLRIELRCFTRDEVGRYLATVSELASAKHLVDRVYRASDGNPLFLTEVVRLLIADRTAGGVEEDLLAPSGIPDTARAVIRRRLDRLSKKCDATLEIAAVIGREFDLRLLAKVTQLVGPSLIGAVDEALAAKVLAEVQALPGRFRFSHALVRDTLYEELSAGRRIELHSRIGEALEQQYASCLDPHLAELAHHFFRAAPADDGAKAVRYALQAAAQSAAGLAHEEAALYYERALRLVEQVGGDERRCCELQLLASENHLRSGAWPKAKEGFQSVMSSASRLGEPELFARAALGAAGPVVALGAAEPATARALEQARRMLPEEDSAVRAHVLARLATETLFSGDRERSIAFTSEAVAMARRLGDPHTLAFALGARRDQQWKGEDLAARLAEAGELLRVAMETGADEVALQARHWRVLDLLELGDRAALDSELKAFEQLAQELRDPLSLYRASALRGAIAVLQGRLADAERLGREFLARGRSISPVNAIQAFEGQRALMLWVRGDIEDALAIAKLGCEVFPNLTHWRAGIAAGLADLGRHEEARREIERFAQDGFTNVPEDLFRAPTLALFGFTCAKLGESELAARVYPLLLPYAGRNMVFGYGAAVWGSIDCFAGLTATAMGRFELAAQHFEAAIELDSRMAAEPFLAEDHYGYAAMLLARNHPGDRARVGTHLAHAQRAAVELGMKALAARVERLLLEAGMALDTEADPAEVGAEPRSAEPRSAEPRSVGVNGRASEWLFRNEGEYWSIGESANPLRLKDGVGLRCLVQLLRQPGREHLALELAGAVRGQGQADLRSVSDPSLDQTALRSYRSRLRELRDALEEAQAAGDSLRASRVEEEIEVVSAELTRALGLGGRIRPLFASASERARQNVTRAIRKAISRIARNDRRVGRHLSTHVRTGTFCSYDPAGDVPVAWVF